MSVEKISPGRSKKIINIKKFCQFPILNDANALMPDHMLIREKYKKTTEIKH